MSLRIRHVPEIVEPTTRLLRRRGENDNGLAQNLGRRFYTLLGELESEPVPEALHKLAEELQRRFRLRRDLALQDGR